MAHAILGFLDVMPLSGYDLKTLAFDRSVAHFWPAVLPQIYRELGRIEESGWATSELMIQEGRPNRKVYSITEAGKEELSRWLMEYQPPPAHREAFLIQLFFAARLEDEEVVALLKRQRAAREARLAELQAIRIPEGAETPAEARRRTLTWLTLDLGLRHERMYLDWLADAISLVEGFGEDG